MRSFTLSPDAMIQNNELKVGKTIKTQEHVLYTTIYAYNFYYSPLSLADEGNFIFNLNLGKQLSCTSTLKLRKFIYFKSNLFRFRQVQPFEWNIDLCDACVFLTRTMTRLFD
jgi:maltose-binding protein MalE